MYCKQCELDHPADAGHFSGPALTTAKRAPRRRVLTHIRRWAHDGERCKRCGAARIIGETVGHWLKDGKPAPYCVTP